MLMLSLQVLKCEAVSADKVPTEATLMNWLLTRLPSSSSGSTQPAVATSAPRTLNKIKLLQLSWIK
jgi:hypothetical protein